MKSCVYCKHANWKRTAAGKLHPSGDGQCTYPWKMPALPACMYFISKQSPEGGHISRKTDLKEHCVYWARKE